MRSDATRCRLAREPRGDEGVGIGDWGDDAVAALSVKVAGRKEGKRRRCRVFLVDGFLKAKSYYPYATTTAAAARDDDLAKPQIDAAGHA